MLSLYNIIATLISWHFNIFTSYSLVFNFTIFTFTNFLHSHTNSNGYYLKPAFKCIFSEVYDVKTQLIIRFGIAKVLNIFDLKFKNFLWIEYVFIYFNFNLDAKYTFYLIYKLSNLYHVIHSY